jgi:hypothetical protein
MKPHPIYLKAARGEYVAGKDIATLIRNTLKVNWPGVAFSVTTKHSVNIRWQDGPPTSLVDSLAGAFETKSFDGMIDLAHSNSLWIYPDGSAHIAHDSGTAGSMGSDPEIIESARRPDAVLLDNVASVFVFCQRTVTRPAFERAISEYRGYWAGAETVDWSAIEIACSNYDGSAYLKNVPSVQLHNGNRWLQDELTMLAYSYDFTQTAEATA